MNARRRLFVIFGIAGLVMLAAFLVLLLRPSGQSAAPSARAGHASLIDVAKRKELPDLSGPALTPPPSTLHLRAPLTKPVFIDVWASWCVPCREEAPMLARLWRRYRGEVRFLGINVEDSRGDARAFIRRYGLGYPNIFDRTATLAGKLGFFGLPTAYLVDARGRIAARLVGRKQPRPLAAALAELARR